MQIEVTDQLVRDIARLARLALSPEELSGVEEHFLKVLQYIEELQRLDTSKVDPSLFSLEASNVVRADEPQPTRIREDVLEAAPRAEHPYFLLPPIVAEAGARGTTEPTAEPTGGEEGDEAP